MRRKFMGKMENIKNLLKNIIAWSNNNIKTDNNYDLLQNQLYEIIKYTFNLSFKFDENDYEDYNNDENNDELMFYINNNFKDFGFYNIVSDVTNKISETKITVGDSTDDLLDIIKDFKEVIWRFENNSINDGLWYLDFGFKSHWGKHASDLLWYLYHLKFGL